MRPAEYKTETASDLLVRARRLSAAEVATVLARMPKLTEQNKRIATRCLVGGETPTAVARDVGLSQQAVSRLCQRVRERFMSMAELDGMPAGWVRAVVVLPKEKMLQVETMQAVALRELSGQQHHG